MGNKGIKENRCVKQPMSIERKVATTVSTVNKLKIVDVLKTHKQISASAAHLLQRTNPKTF